MHTKPEVLLVEDNVALGLSTMDTLRALGYSTMLATSAADAHFQLTSSRQLVALILDLELGQQRGDTLVAELLATEHVLPPIVVFSGQPDQDLKAAAKRVGAAAVLRKPCSIEDIKRVLDGIVAH